ncbi:MAG: T9SS type A sorting domain-containing protein [Chitinophagaceae bacterium]|nr:T9SS type A sorting domain-containing protein [Chitinophagaceae bacterium]
MKTFYSIIVLVSLMVINTVAQTTQTVRTSQISTNLGLVKPSMLGFSQRTEDCDTFSNLCPDDSLVIYTTSAGGYVAGQNGYGDISKADVFKLPGTTIKGVMLFFGVGTAADTVNQFKVRIWDNDSLFADGSTGAPGTVLAETLVKYNDVKNDVANGDMTYVEFDPDVTMPADSTFYAGINFGYNAGDTIALVTTMERTGFSCDGKLTAFEEWSPDYYGGGWYSYETWGFTGVSHAIYPVTCDDVCNVPGNFTLKNVTATSIKIKWGEVDGANSYKLRYKPAGTGMWTWLSPTGHTKTIEGLSAATEYVFQIKSVCGLDPKITSDWSAKHYFTTAEFKLAAGLANPTVAVFPNPTTGSAVISFFLFEDAPTTVVLYDLVGRKLQTILDQNLAAGNQEIVFQRGQLSSGLYLLEVKLGEQVEVKKLMIE